MYCVPCIALLVCIDNNGNINRYACLLGINRAISFKSHTLKILSTLCLIPYTIYPIYGIILVLQEYLPQLTKLKIIKHQTKNAR